MRSHHLRCLQFLLVVLTHAFGNCAAADCTKNSIAPAEIRVLYPQVVDLVFAGPADSPDTMATLKLRIDLPEQPESQVTIVQHRSGKFTASRQLLQSKMSIWEQIAEQACSTGQKDAQSIARNIKLHEEIINVPSAVLKDLVDQYSKTSVPLYRDPFVVELHATYYSVAFASEYSSFSASIAGSTPDHEHTSDQLIQWMLKAWNTLMLRRVALDKSEGVVKGANVS